MSDETSNDESEQTAEIEEPAAVVDEASEPEPTTAEAAPAAGAVPTRPTERRRLDRFTLVATLGSVVALGAAFGAGFVVGDHDGDGERRGERHDKRMGMMRGGPMGDMRGGPGEPGEMHGGFGGEGRSFDDRDAPDHDAWRDQMDPPGALPATPDGQRPPDASEPVPAVPSAPGGRGQSPIARPGG